MFSPDEVQLFYQIAIHGRNDMAAAPDEYAGFTMARCAAGVCSSRRKDAEKPACCRNAQRRGTRSPKTEPAKTELPAQPKVQSAEIQPKALEAPAASAKSALSAQELEDIPWDHSIATGKPVFVPQGSESAFLT